MLASVVASFCAFVSASAPAVELDVSADRADTPFAPRLKRIGTLRPRSTMEIRSSNWMVGCECNDRWARVRDSSLSTTDGGVAVYEYAKDTGERMYLFWRFSDRAERDENPLSCMNPPGADLKFTPVRPGDSFAAAPQVFCVGDGSCLKDPVFVDLLSGRVYEFPRRKVAASEDATRYIGVPLYDSPCFLTERSALDIVEDRH